MRKTLIFLAVLALVVACGNGKTKLSSEDPGSHHHGGEIEMSEEQQAAFGVETITLEKTNFQEVITCTGKIVPAAADEFSVVAPASGVVSLPALSEGSRVAKGDLIASISGKGIKGGDDLERAWESYQLAAREYERDTQLLQDNIISRSHYEESKFAYEQAGREYLALSGGSQQSAGSQANAPEAGWIKEVCVRSGDYVEAGQTLALVSRNEKLQLRAMVPERYFSYLPNVCTANFKTSYSDKVWSVEELGGRLISYGRTTGEGMMIPIIFELPGSKEFIPGSYADVYLMTSARREAFAVPVTAVVEDEGEHFVFVKHEEDAFIRKHVTIGQGNGREVLVLSGLEGDEEVVVKAAVQVKLAGAVSAPSGHNHQH